MIVHHSFSTNFVSGGRDWEGKNKEATLSAPVVLVKPVGLVYDQVYLVSC